MAEAGSGQEDDHMEIGMAHTRCRSRYHSRSGNMLQAPVQAHPPKEHTGCDPDEW